MGKFIAVFVGREKARGPGVMFLLVTLAAALAYCNGLSGSFIWDDRNLVVNNLHTHGLSHILDLLGWGTGHFSFRMVRDLSYQLDYSIGGLNPLVYHVSNLVWHVVCSLLVVLLAQRITGTRVAALWAGLIFAVHPVHVDAVSYISGRRDVLSTALYLASILLFARFRDSRGSMWLVLAGLTGILGSMAKEMAATFPLAWLLYDCWREGGTGLVAGFRVALRRYWWLYGAGGAASGGLIAYMVLVQHLTAQAGPYGGTWPAHVMSEVVILAYALKLLVWPAPLLIDYQHFIPPVTSPLEPRFLLSAGVLAGAALLTGRLFSNRRSAAFAAHWLWITYLPVMQIVPHPERFAEHYLYLPSVGGALLFGMGLARLSTHIDRRRAVAAAGVVCLTLAVATISHNRVYGSERSAYEAGLAIHPRGHRMRNNLAMAYQEQGRTDDAIAMLEAGMAYTRDPLLVTNLAWLLGREQRWAEAEKWLLDAYGNDPREPRVLFRLGVAFSRQGKVRDAERAWRELLAVQPDAMSALVGLAQIRQREGDLREAETLFARAVEIHPENAAAWTGLGMSLSGLGNTAGAEHAFRRAAALAPEDGDTWNNLGILAARKEDPDTAERAFRRALRARTPPPSARVNLARLLLREKHDCKGARAVLGGKRSRNPKVQAAVRRLLREIETGCAVPGIR